jgi:hypothetical protein
MSGNGKRQRRSRSLRDDSQKNNGNDNGQGKSNGQYGGLSTAHHEDAMMLRSR